MILLADTNVYTSSMKKAMESAGTWSSDNDKAYNNYHKVSTPVVAPVVKSTVLSEPSFDYNAVFTQMQNDFSKQLSDLQLQWKTQSDAQQAQVNQANAYQASYLNNNKGVLGGTAQDSSSGIGLNTSQYQAGVGNYNPVKNVRNDATIKSSAISRYLKNNPDMWSQKL